MVGPFPVFKLGTLAIKQIAKPVANFLKRRAKSNQFFRQYVCLPPANLYHLFETRLKYRILGLSKPKDVSKMNEDSAADLGAEMLGEFLIFMLGATCLFLEYRRQAKKETNKEELIQSTLIELTNKINELSLMEEIQEAKLKELTRVIATMTK